MGMRWRVQERLLCLTVRPLTLRSHGNGLARAVNVHTRCSKLLNPDSQDDLSSISSANQVTIKGLVQSVRKQKKWAFAHITDGSTVKPIQAILTPEQAEHLTTGAAVQVTGKWEPSPAQGQANELKASSIETLGEADPKTYPIQKKYHTPGFLRSIPHLRLRTPLAALVARIRSECIFSLSRYFHEHQELGPFSQIQPPLLTSSDCEGAGEVFTVTPQNAQPEQEISEDAGDGAEEMFFRDPAYLTVSTQLHLEAYAASIGSVWTLTPSFRAEFSDTPRHLAEFWMLEVEVQYLDSLDSLMDLTESMIRTLIRSLKQTAVGQELLAYKQPFSDEDESYNAELDLVARWDGLDRSSPWPRLAYSSAVKLLKDAAKANPKLFVHEPHWHTGFQLEHENWLAGEVGLGAPLFITDYPKVIKPFYMLPSATGISDGGNMKDTEGRQTVSNFDLLLPGGMAEVVGGSLREHRLDRLLENMRAAGMIQSTSPASQASTAPASDPSSPDIQSTTQDEPPRPSSPPNPYPHLLPNENLENNPLKWYVDLRRYGSAPHGGFGLGFERLIAYLAGLRNVRDVVGFPRSWRRIDA